MKSYASNQIIVYCIEPYFDRKRDTLMTKDITIAIIAAFGGGLFTLVVAYLNTRAKRFELEYNFKCKMQENYHANAKLHIEDLYLPLYKRLASFENISKETNETNKQNTIMKLMNYQILL